MHNDTHVKLPPSLSAKPVHTPFDAWNSSSTGHQRAENRLSGSTSWRDSRTLKLSEQFSSGSGGGRRVADTVGGGSEGFGIDGRLENAAWERGAQGLRGSGQRSLGEMWGLKKSGVEDRAANAKLNKGLEAHGKLEKASSDVQKDTALIQDEKKAQRKEPQIFAGLAIYINGSTAPLISDHKLKHLLVLHGARLSIALGRRTVTHVILGRPNSRSTSGGSGGGLAATKIQKEITSKVGNNSVKFVTAEWVLECIKQGKRVGEAQFSAMRLAPTGTVDLKTMFAKAKD